MGKVSIEHTAKELKQIDEQVGLDVSTKEVTFGSTVFEWAQVKGKETKPPEQVHYWNSSLLNEVVAEADLYLAHYFIDYPTRQSVPTISYEADGMAEGATVLIGGDHGDKNCPISAKLNLTSPQERKRRGELNYLCPIVQFASIECSKDTYDLLVETVMSGVKEQVSLLADSAIVTVHHSRDPTCFKSFVVSDPLPSVRLTMVRECS